MDDVERRHSFLRGPNAVLVIPMMALSIPIVAILQDPLSSAFAPVAVVGAATLSARYLLLFRHRLKLDEIRAQERVALAERDRFAAIEGLLEREGIPRDPD